jgi:hypothetical protein
MNLSNIRHIQITGECVTFDKTDLGWIVTGWEKGLPICRKPMTEQGVINTLTRYKNQEAIILSPA